MDNLTELKGVDDAAVAAWGGKWRVPTENEFHELLKYCDLTWEKQGTVYGALLMSIKSITSG